MEIKQSANAAFESEAPALYRFGYHGEGGAFFVLLLKNILLTLLTVGIYAAWATAARRRYIWSNVDFHGQRLVFTGTGGELFLGYLKVAGVYLALFTPPFVAQMMGARFAGTALQVLAAVILFVLVPYAIYGSRAYLLSRTRWRGIKLGLVGSSAPYVKTFVAGVLLSVVTLGLYWPFASVQLQTIITNNTRFGSEPFS